jgi:hypothetical protein
MVAGTMNVTLDFATNASLAYTLKVRIACMSVGTAVLNSPVWGSFLTNSGTASSTLFGVTRTTFSNLGCTAGQDFDLEIQRTDVSSGTIHVRGMILSYQQTVTLQ